MSDRLGEVKLIASLLVLNWEDMHFKSWVGPTRESSLHHQVMDAK